MLHGLTMRARPARTSVDTWLEATGLVAGPATSCGRACRVRAGERTGNE